MNSIAVTSLAVSRQNRSILNDLNFAITPGSIVGLLGPSGAGKTTLMRVLMGLQAITSGEATILGLPAGSSELRSQIGYVTQAPAVYGDLTVQQNLAYFGRLVHASSAHIEATMTTLQLNEVRNNLVQQTSGGQHARVSLAVALLGQPKLLILDEPTVGLDPIMKAELWGYLKQLAANGITLLISSHVMDEAANCDQLLLLREGRLLAQGTPKQLQKSAGAKTTEEAFIKLVQGIKQ